MLVQFSLLEAILLLKYSQTVCFMFVNHLLNLLLNIQEESITLLKT